MSRTSIHADIGCRRQWLAVGFGGRLVVAGASDNQLVIVKKDTVYSMDWKKYSNLQAKNGILLHHADQ